MLRKKLHHKSTPIHVYLLRYTDKEKVLKMAPRKLKTAFRIIPELQNKSGLQINIRMMRYDTVIIRTIHAFSG